LKTGLLRVTATKKPPYRSRVDIRPTWLADFGFVHGTSLYAVPFQDGFSLTFWDDNSATGNGKLVRVGLEKNKNVILVYLANNFITELVGGDHLVASYEYGNIKAKKLPDAQKYYVVSSQGFGAFLQLSGEWLTTIGFIPDTIATVSSTKGKISINIWNGEPSKYDELVKYSRKHKLQPIQVRKNQHVVILDLMGYTLAKAGFNTGDFISVNYEHGTINLSKTDLQSLGFQVPRAY